MRPLVRKFSLTPFSFNPDIITIIIVMLMVFNGLVYLVLCRVWTLDSFTTYVAVLKAEGKVFGIPGKRIIALPEAKDNGQLDMSSFLLVSFVDTSDGRLYCCPCSTAQGQRIRAVLAATSPTVEFCSSEREQYCVHCRALDVCVVEHATEEEADSVAILCVMPFTASVCNDVRHGFFSLVYIVCACFILE